MKRKQSIKLTRGNIIPLAILTLMPVCLKCQLVINQCLENIRIMLSATMNNTYYSLYLTAFSETATEMWFSNRLYQLEFCAVLVCLKKKRTIYPKEFIFFFNSYICVIVKSKLIKIIVMCNIRCSFYKVTFT